MDSISIEKKQVRFIIRQLEILKTILSRLRASYHEEDEKILKTEISSILRSFRSGIFNCEERIEYRSARNFMALREAFAKLSSELSYAEHQELSGLLAQARVYHAKLEKFGARGGMIEAALREAQKNPKNKAHLMKIEKLIEEAIQDDLSFEAVMGKLINASKKTKKIKSKFSAYRQIESLAVTVIGNWIIILYDQNKLREELENYNILFGAHTPETEEARKELRKELERLREKGRRIPDPSGIIEGDLLSYLGNKMVDNVIIGYCQMSWKYKKEQFLGAYEIYRIAARQGWGLFFLELVLSQAALQHAPVILDRQETSPAIRKLWEYVDLHRPAIIKYPAALMKYPELIGFSKREVLELFGPAVVGSSVFDEYGFPAGLSREIVDKLKIKAGSSPDIWEQLSWKKSYLKKESKLGTNPLLGGIASLDKAYYYDGETKTLAALLRQGRKDKGKTFLMQDDFKAAGYFFFQESKPRAGLYR